MRYLIVALIAVAGFTGAAESVDAYAGVAPPDSRCLTASPRGEIR